MTDPTNFEEILSDDPGNPIFAEFAESLRQQGTRLAALSVCLAGLSANPTCHRGRLVLARVFFDLGYHAFAVRELEELSIALPKVESITKLLNKFDPGRDGRRLGDKAPYPQSDDVGRAGCPQPAATEETVAETEFDLAEIELATEDEK